MHSDIISGNENIDGKKFTRVHVDIALWDNNGCGYNENLQVMWIY